MESKSKKREGSKAEEENMVREMLEFYTLVPPSPYLLKGKRASRRKNK